MRARYPDVEGYVERDGVKVAYEVYGDGPTTVVFFPIDAIVHSRAWKAQIPYLSRFYRVVAIDPRGNGRSDRPTDPAAYAQGEYIADCLAVMDEVGVERAVLVGICTSALACVVTAAQHPERVLGVFAVAPWLPPYMAPPHPFRAPYAGKWAEEQESYEGWGKSNKHFWLQDWRGWTEFFFGQMFVEPHSSKQWEDVVGFANETDAQTMVAEAMGDIPFQTPEELVPVLQSVACPVLVVYGDEDRCQPQRRAELVAELTRGRLVLLGGAGHLPMAREPVVVNRLLREFVEQVAPAAAPLPRQWTRSLDRPKKLLFVSSPIGLGHTRRDIAIVDELRTLRPDLQVDWLTQPPVSDVLERRGERIHPACRFLAGETSHVESESGEHDLHAFQAIRRMDEILVNNFMVFDELVREERYDAWVADEGWDVDYFLHENPELKSTAYAWITDFVGWLPFPDGGERERWLTTDYNAEMVEHVARFPRLRDRSLFVGDPDDCVPDSLGDGLPTIRDWTSDHFDFTGYVTGSAPMTADDRSAVRERLGWRDEPRVVVAVGGTAVGEPLLRRAIAAYPLAAARVPGLRMTVVTGPRIDPASLPAPDGVDVVGYVPDLDRVLGASDLGLVQGGLTTCMELVANQRPFLFVPLRHHFEQSFHVAHRLARYGAGRRLDYETDTAPEPLADAIAAEIGRPVSYLPVARDGAARAAARLADLV